MKTLTKRIILGLLLSMALPIYGNMCVALAAPTLSYKPGDVIMVKFGSGNGKMKLTFGAASSVSVDLVQPKYTWFFGKGTFDPAARKATLKYDASTDRTLTFDENMTRVIGQTQTYKQTPTTIQNSKITYDKDGFVTSAEDSGVFPGGTRLSLSEYTGKNVKKSEYNKNTYKQQLKESITEQYYQNLTIDQYGYPAESVSFFANKSTDSKGAPAEDSLITVVTQQPSMMDRMKRIGTTKIYRKFSKSSDLPSSMAEVKADSNGPAENVLNKWIGRTLFLDVYKASADATGPAGNKYYKRRTPADAWEETVPWNQRTTWN